MRHAVFIENYPPLSVTFRVEIIYIELYVGVLFIIVINLHNQYTVNDSILRYKWFRE